MTTIYKTIACKFDQSIQCGLINAPLKGGDAVQYKAFINELYQVAKSKKPSADCFYSVQFTRQDQCEASNATCAITRQPAPCYVYRIDFEYSNM